MRSSFCGINYDVRKTFIIRTIFNAFNFLLQLFYVTHSSLKRECFVMLLVLLCSLKLQCNLLYKKV